MGKFKRRKKTVDVQNMVQAASSEKSRAWINWPVLNPKSEVSQWDKERIWRRARSLYANCPEVRHAVNTLAMMVGTITPRPCSGDEEWDRMAREAFLNRVNNPYLFDVQGTMTWNSAQLWLEKRAIIDGDSLTVLTTGRDGGGQIALYAAPQITSDGRYDKPLDGVQVDSKGRVRAYELYDYAQNKPVQISAFRSILYRHNPDPVDHRGASELIAAITTAQDVYEIIGYNKASIKFASLFGLVETQDVNVRQTGMSDLASMRNPGRNAVSSQSQMQPTIGARVGETQAITLSPGHRLETIHDNRPSNEVREFIKSLVDSIAYAVGLDPVILYNTQDMGSASARFVIAKSKDVIQQRLNDRIVWANKLYQYILSCEVAAGRLPKCPTENWSKVKWISSSGWSIDLGRDANSAMDLIARGLMSADDYCLSSFGKTSEEIFAENLHSVTHNMERAKQAGVDYYAIAAPQSGSTYVPKNVIVSSQSDSLDDDGLQNS